jgi:hypothetical protein
MQPKVEFRANKSKEMQAKALAFVFISFAESELFNGLQPMQIKNFISASARAPSCE